MIDIKEVILKQDEYQENCNNRLLDIDVQKVISLYNKQKELKGKLDLKRAERNELANKMKDRLPNEERNLLVEKGKLLKKEVSDLEKQFDEIKSSYDSLLFKLPNFTSGSSPIGKEEDSKVLREVGIKKKFDFEIKDHLELGLSLDILNFDIAAQVTGNKFYYLKNQGALLEMALVQFVINKLVNKGFSIYITPDLARNAVVEGIGYNPRGVETNIYSIEKTELCLIGTSEITLGGMCSNRIFKSSELPLCMAGYSHCFRTEAGAAGQESKGLYRVHQFTKVEIFIICKPEESTKYHRDILSIEEEIYKELKIPYRVLDIATGDLGNPAYKKYDIEAWMPGRNAYGEITSTSNCTDFQARRLNIKFLNENESLQYVHMLNGTAVAVPRVIIAILENYQNSDGTVDIPEVLQPYLRAKKIAKI